MATSGVSSTSHNLRLPHDQVPADGNRNVTRAAPHCPGVCQGHKVGGSLLSGHDEISPVWEGHYKDVPSPKCATVTKDRRILRR
jgi:hypothetical protein